ncbi:sigma 54-interacting transcriptional regulator [bacterium]|nr:sigma 54-interacting transcriptional regulator [bacterium]
MISGYSIVGELFRGKKRVVYRAFRNEDSLPVIIKILSGEFPTASDLADLRREYEILKSLQIDGVAKALDLKKDQKTLALILQDAGGTPLRKLMDGPMDLPLFFEIAIPLGRILGELHQNMIIHKDINPKNIIVNPNTRKTELIDFSIASRLPRLDQKLTHPDLLEGTLAYISPEQTGRMNRLIDYLSDFYSLGVTFYEMLTGHLPFESRDPLELVHWHIAKPPKPPIELNPAVPQPLSNIILKLLSKTAEERYLSGFSLKKDLERSWEEFQKTGTIQPFALGEQEASDRFNIPQRLYGRDKELETLLRSFDRVSNGAVELLMVSGYSGIGKTSLIHEIYKPVVARKAYFTGGKFDQLNRVVPYSGLIQAFRELVRQLLTENVDQIEIWKNRLLNSLRSNAQIIIDVIPEVELILGKQPPVAELGPVESQNRFNLVFQNFIRNFAKPEHPLVIFLDDLQWADSATLKLLQSLVNNPDISHLFVIGAYRDNEVSPSHPLIRTLAEMQNGGAELNQILMRALAMPDLNQLIADTIKCKKRASAPLAHLVMSKTLGNPFFVTQFLKALHQEDLIYFDYASGQWKFLLDQIRNIDMTDNVVDLMARKLQTFSSETRHALILAACMGNRFDIDTLSVVSEQSIEQTRNQLWEAILNGFLVPLDQNESFSRLYKFLHDRIQQAAYDLIPHDKKAEVHLKVGELMLAGNQEAELDEKIFEIVNHMNLGSALIESDQKRFHLAGLNLQAGRKAKSSTAYEAALGYFRAGINLLNQDSWSLHYDLTFDLYLQSAECEYLCGQFDRAEQSFDLLLKEVESPLGKAKVQTLRILQYENVSRYQDAIRVGHEALQLFGLSFPKDRLEKRAALQKEISAIDALVGDRAIQSLIDLPEMTDPQIRTVMELLSNLHTSCYLSGDEPLTLLNTTAMVRLSLLYGNREESAYGYVLYAAMLLGPKRKDYKSAYEFGLLAQQVNDRFHNPTIRARVLMNFAWAISLWRMPIENSFPITREAFRLAHENGLFVEASYALFNESWFYLLAGRDLSTFRETYRTNVDYNKRVKMHRFADGQQVILQWGSALEGLTKNPTSFSDQNFDEALFRQSYEGHSLFEMFYFVSKLAVLYTFDEFVAALQIAEEAERVIQDFNGTIWDELTVFYKAVTLAALHTTAVDPVAIENELEQLNARLRLWAENAPYTFRLQYFIVSAEIARIRGDFTEAMNLFESAIELSGGHDCPREGALASELYAKFWLLRNNQKIARAYMNDAYQAYTQWGAIAKAKSLQSKYPEWIDRDEKTSGLSGPLLTSHVQPGTLDAFAIAKAAQAISSEIVLERLLEKLIRIILENAGAQKALLIRNKEEEFWIQAEGSLEGVQVSPFSPVKSSTQFSHAVVNYVKRTRQSVVIASAEADPTFAQDPYIQEHSAKSIMCLPILHQNNFIGILYLENNLMTEAFTFDRIQLVQTLSSQSAISLEIARLYKEMQQEIEQRKQAEEALRKALSEVEKLKNKLEAENIYLQEEIKSEHNFEQIVGTSQPMRKLFQNIEKVSRTDATVLVIGETGTGKELVARAIHTRSKRKDSPLITVNCAALPSGLIESELFGHEKGAFTGASARKKGRFELADGGSIFLDEVGELPFETQTKLLRVLQEQEFERVGGIQPLKVDVRVIAATNKDLQETVKNGAFRADLFYRLNIFPIQLPALRDRQEDIRLLTSHFVNKFSRRMRKKIDRVSPKANDILLSYSWPGNVRELANVLERAVILCEGGVLDQEHLAIAASHSVQAVSLSTLEETERSHILRALEKTRWVVGGAFGAARMLGLNRTTLIARMKKLGIARPNARVQ